MYVPLGKSDVDAVGGEAAVDSFVKLVGEEGPLQHIFVENPQLEV